MVDRGKSKSVTGQLATHIREYIDETGEKEIRTADDAFQTMGQFEGEGTFSVHFTSAARHAEGWRLEIYGTKGTIVMTHDNKVMLGIGDGPLEEVELIVDLQAPKQMSTVAAGYYNAFYRAFDAVCEAVEDGKSNPYLPLFEDGHEVQLILDAIRKSDNERKTIVLR